MDMGYFFCNVSLFDNIRLIYISLGTLYSAVFVYMYSIYALKLPDIYRNFVNFLSDAGCWKKLCTKIQFARDNNFARAYEVEHFYFTRMAVHMQMRDDE